MCIQLLLYHTHFAFLTYNFQALANDIFMYTKLPPPPRLHLKIFKIIVNSISGFQQFYINMSVRFQINKPFYKRL